MTMNAKPTESLRLFFALWPDDATRTALMQLQTSLRGRLIPYLNIHLTLAFLGQQPVTILPAAKKIITHLRAPSSTLILDRVGYFPRNRVAWVGTHTTPDALISLSQELALALKEHDISCDMRQPFKPHITLARDASPPPDFAFTPIEWHASQIALVQSVTRPEGSVYEVLASRSLDEACWVPDESGDEMSRQPAS
ncbi:RNA 2',3'-cyclic phosphodiesterase [Noviherbaspirillum sp.]|jgi:2'-5' RNA ligase|uniref:RNA 2',3'-cyclic phosphodiesterase n=1 Tax=Noviherbaspirillum sp. TaxID=1926288 RepID=UPI0025FAF736|nr:RNA 2',3'-cyclic phosphodiesterase [Noviherbaspirillum sp.]